MPGPIPKDPQLVQRRNKVTTAAKLTDGTRKRRAPSLPKHRDWHPLTIAWWRDTWHSPMAAEFLESDIHGLYLLAELVDQFWTEPTKELAAEIRLQRQCFGLTPIDRRRLQWEVEKVESATRRQSNRTAPRPAQPVEDPRAALRAVK